MGSELDDRVNGRDLTVGLAAVRQIVVTGELAPPPPIIDHVAAGAVAHQALPAGHPLRRILRLPARATA